MAGQTDRATRCSPTARARSSSSSRSSRCSRSSACSWPACSSGRARSSTPTRAPSRSARVTPSEPRNAGCSGCELRTLRGRCSGGCAGAAIGGDRRGAARSVATARKPRLVGPRRADQHRHHRARETSRSTPRPRYGSADPAHATGGLRAARIARLNAAMRSSCVADERARSSPPVASTMPVLSAMAARSATERSASTPPCSGRRWCSASS